MDGHIGIGAEGVRARGRESKGRLEGRSTVDEFTQIFSSIQERRMMEG